MSFDESGLRVWKKMRTLVDENFFTFWQVIGGSGEEIVSCCQTGSQTVPRFGNLEHFCTGVDTYNWMTKTCKPE